jgi:branched-chain amino acid transport system substrate-binding protein
MTMMHGLRSLVPAFGLAFLLCGSHAVADETPFDINVVLPLTGPAALFGGELRLSIEQVEKVANADGGINGRPVHFVFSDDQSSPQVAVQIVTQLIASNPPVIIGPSLAATCNAVAPLLTNGTTDYCTSPAIQPKVGGNMFSAGLATDDLLPAVLRYFQYRGWKRLGMITTTDASGQDGERAFDLALSRPDFNDVKIIERVHYNVGDVTAAAQVERLKAAQPQAVLAWATSVSVALTFRGMIQSGLDAPVAVSTINELYTVMRQFGPILPKDLYIGSGQGSARGEGLRLTPEMAAKKKRLYDAYAALGRIPDIGAESPWDATTIVIDALRHVGTNATGAQVHDYIAHLTNFVGVTGVYDFQKFPQRGLDQHSAVVVRWNAAQTMFEAVSNPGGLPLSP